MADEQFNQAELDKLLAQVQGAGTPAAAPSAAPDLAGAIRQDEVDSLLASTAAMAPPRPAPKPASKPAPTSSSAGSRISEEGMATGDVEFLLQQAEMALASVTDPVAPTMPGPALPFKFQDFSGAPPSSESATLALIRDVELDVKIELGRTQMVLEDLLRLHKGSVVALDKLAGDPVDVYVNGRLIARGEVLVLNDNFCVRVAELVAGDEEG